MGLLKTFVLNLLILSLMGTSLSGCFSIRSVEVDATTTTEPGVCDLGIDPAANGFHSGTGTAGDPYTICDAGELNTFFTQINLGNYLDKNFKLIQSIDLAGAAIDPADLFDGTFDGDGKTISNFTYNGSTDTNVGFFRELSATAVVENLSLSNFTITGGRYSGALVGVNHGTVTNCSANGTITSTIVASAVITDSALGGLVGKSDGAISESNTAGTLTGSIDATTDYGEIYVGGLVGDHYLGTIDQCSSTATIAVSAIDPIGMWVGITAGGLLGNNGYTNNGGTVTNSTASGNVSVTTVSGDSWGAVGGLIGSAYLGSITKSSASGNVSSDADNYYTGGLFGYSFIASFSNDYSTGNVSGSGASSRVGGLAGYSKGLVEKCYTVGLASGTAGAEVGAIAGELQASVDNSFWNSDISGALPCNGHFPGDVGCSGGSTGQTTANMKTSTTFTNVGWDFAAIWTIVSGAYPSFL